MQATKMDDAGISGDESALRVEQARGLAYVWVVAPLLNDVSTGNTAIILDVFDLENEYEAASYTPVAGAVTDGIARSTLLRACARFACSIPPSKFGVYAPGTSSTKSRMEESCSLVF